MEVETDQAIEEPTEIIHINQDHEKDQLLSSSVSRFHSTGSELTARDSPGAGTNARDQECRFDFCNFVLNTLDENPEFFNEVLWSDESQFSRQGTINTQNRHYWSLENPTFNTTESPTSALVGECMVWNME
ncbi:uncharacterized protein TNCV_3158111 [Trichonephila clavipes]|nr:uncharacterized protein TNCV_3158111 [Trichonephila clavipes]